MKIQVYDHSPTREQNAINNGEFVPASDYTLPAGQEARGCDWTEDEDGNWHTGCGEMFVFTTDGPVENKMRFCPYCGKALVTNGGA